MRIKDAPEARTLPPNMPHCYAAIPLAAPHDRAPPLTQMKTAEVQAPTVFYLSIYARLFLAPSFSH